MQDKNKLHQEISKSEQAKAILESPVFIDSINKLKKLYSDSLFKSGAGEETTREKLWLAYNIIGKVEQHFTELVETGKLAKKQLEDLRSQEQQKKF